MNNEDITELEKQYRKEINYNGLQPHYFYMCDYVKWLEKRLSTIVQQSLSGSEQSSSQKCSHEMIYPCDGSKPVCKKCGVVSR